MAMFVHNVSFSNYLDIFLRCSAIYIYIIYIYVMFCAPRGTPNPRQVSTKHDKSKDDFAGNINQGTCHKSLAYVTLLSTYFTAAADVSC